MKRITSQWIGVVAGLAGTVACGTNDGEHEPSAAVTLTRGEATLALSAAAFYQISDYDTGDVLETVILVHNSTNPCPYGCTAESLGQPTDGAELALVKFVFDGPIAAGVHTQGGAFIHSRLAIGTAGCGSPGQLGSDGEAIGGQPPGMQGELPPAGRTGCLCRFLTENGT
jgi:hypothetical protein